MEKIKIEPYEDFEEIRRKGEDYIQRILLGASFFEQHGRNLKPIVFMSEDIMNAIARGYERALGRNKETPTKLSFTVCGKRMTNYEYIKTFSVQQMANFLKNDKCDLCNRCIYTCDSSGRDCEKGIMEWLKSESEE